MRFRSILAVLVIGLTSLGFVGCGSSETNTDFVSFADTSVQPNSGNLVFNFVKAQQAFTVDANTASFRIEVFGTAADPILTVTRPFAATVRVDGVSTAATAVRITGFDANGFPLFTIGQAVSVAPGKDAIVDAVSNVVPVTLSRLRLAPGNLADVAKETTLTQVDLETGGTGQVFLFAEYSEGSVVIVGQQGTYTVVDPSVVTVNEAGTLRSLRPGRTQLLAQFAGQTLSVPVSVTDNLNQNFSSIAVTNTPPVVVTAAGPGVVITTRGVRATDSFVFGLNPANTALAYEVDNTTIFNISAAGLLTAVAEAPDGVTGIVTVTHTNADGTKVSSNVAVRVGPVPTETPTP